MAKGNCKDGGDESMARLDSVDSKARKNVMALAIMEADADAEGMEAFSIPASVIRCCSVKSGIRGSDISCNIAR